MSKPIYFLFLIMMFQSAMNGQNPYEKIKPIKEEMQILPFGSIKPQGWIKEQIQQNLDGFTGHLDSLAPDLIIKDAIYDKDRLTRKIKNKDVGALGNEGDWQVQFLWWNSETQSNWRDGYIRSAILANDSEHLKRIEKYIQHILDSQDEDGYLGIYDNELRYKFDNENGELWAQTTLLRGLLAWYEYKNDQKILNAVKKAAANTMKGFPIDKSHPFYSTNPNVGGLSHGLTFTDILENLYRITNDQKYLDYVLFLYKDFSSQVLNEDAQYTKLLQKDLMLAGHERPHL
ncbi:beta-L-arabinofuranosidase domain-containing protein [Flavobacterium sp. 3HN19-14]|uniref:beta-L-arabinofuranosidase domain-containing protein n=1 Tax=Flavobacterium sp. 3HN19-14 TaxID=3448133 RepID=UPI003EE249C1